MLRGTSVRSVQPVAFDDVALTFVTQNTLPSFKINFTWDLLGSPSYGHLEGDYFGSANHGRQRVLTSQQWQP
ncbi:hypothetical protein DPMN_156213 [Dreissena polymorpha]|uniref:Uncharacterized protein n=1 Tax=Dreissena polymorpha TaxID=45954 RepID=A0A9D4J8L2_DREPO|nr:hypothetical protein DPMN_156213 [Dreissena polymorpha]